MVIFNLCWYFSDKYFIIFVHLRVRQFAEKKKKEEKQDLFLSICATNFLYSTPGHL